MKKIILSFMALVLAVMAFSQSTTDFKKVPTLSVNFFFKDFKTPDNIYTNSLGTVLASSNWTKLGDMYSGVQVQYSKGLTNNLDFATGLSGSFVHYPFLAVSGKTSPVGDKFLLEADANIHFKLLTDNHFFVPYFILGAGASLYNGTYLATYAPIGGGLQFRLGEGSFIHMEGTYRVRITDLANYNFQYAIGIASPLSDNKEPVVLAAPPPPPPAPEAEKDTDGDGIVDSKDKCPTVPGTAKYDGCPVPDTDGDGINDENDKCPTVKGLAKYNGCPVPDRDHDGINDEEDKCPDVPGVARYQGCPVPDTDGDGVNDEEDKCPTEKGTRANNGCPEMKDFAFEAKNVQFVTGSAVLTKIAIAELDKGAKILADHPTLNILIDGHTDNVGTAELNKKLSQKRADAVKDFLVKKGVNASSLTATGYGFDQPIADNKTDKGRTENRRVEFKVKK